MIVAAAIVAGIGFTPQIAEDSTADTSRAGDVVEPTFRISKFRNEIRLEGHTISVAQEKQLIAEAKFSFPNYAVSAEFIPLGMVPPHWEGSTVQLLHALTAADSGTAQLSKSRLTFNVVATDDLSWASNLRSLTAAIPDGIEIFDESISIGRKDVGAMCRDATSQFSMGPVNFQESTVELRPSAHPRLEQLAALADACRDSLVRVTGHTDASGDEDWNKSLSLLRARVVADYLHSKGIAKERIEAVGLGSVAPIASNDNRYGRSLNRRIEVEFVSD